MISHALIRSHKISQVKISHDIIRSHKISYDKISHDLATSHKISTDLEQCDRVHFGAHETRYLVFRNHASVLVPLAHGDIEDMIS